MTPCDLLAAIVSLWSSIACTLEQNRSETEQSRGLHLSQYMDRSAQLETSQQRCREDELAKALVNIAVCNSFVLLRFEDEKCPTALDFECVPMGVVTSLGLTV